MLRKFFTITTRFISNHPNETHKTILDNVRVNLNLPSFAPECWQKVRVNQFSKSGGAPLLKEYKSLFNVLQTLNPGYNYLGAIKLPQNYWESKENQLRIFELLKEKYNIKSPEDWKNIRVKEITQYVVIGNIINKYGGLIETLKELYPNDKWSYQEHRNRVHSNYWKDSSTHKAFMEDLGNKLGFKEEKDWYSLDQNTIKQHGGARLLTYYKSIFELLQKTVPNYQWDVLQMKNLPKQFWKDINNQREFMKRFEKDHNFKSIDDWNKTSVQEFAQCGGGSLLALYSSFSALLATIYPDHTWHARDRNMLPKHYWQELKNQREFLEDLERKFKIDKRTDWTKAYNRKKIPENGGSGLLSCYENYYDCLRTIFPEIKWQIIWFSALPVKFWEKPENQLQFLKEFEEKHKITEREQWYDISPNFFKANKGRVLFNLYENSFYKLLSKLVPDYKWEPTSFSAPRCWDSLIEQRKFMDEIAQKLNVKEPQDWNNVQYRDIHARGGHSLLIRYPSLYDALKAIYPEVKWDIYQRKHFPKKYWEDPSNIRDYLEYFKKIFKIKTNEDWYRVSLQQLEKHKGYGLIAKYKKLHTILSIGFPEVEWSAHEFKSRNKKSAQRWLFLKLLDLYPNEEIIEDYLHAQLTRISDMCIQFDVFIPALNIAFEYHGYHHYHDHPVFGGIELQRCRDKEKTMLCAENNIKLVVVPYYWDETIESLEHLISEQIGSSFIPQKI